jgi:hypothetical protein
MIASIEDLVAVRRLDPDLAGALAGCDWYLVGPRAAGTGDELSDWDTVALSPVDPADEGPADHPSGHCIPDLPDLS